VECGSCSRQVVTTLVTFAGGAVLARALNPADFGTYAIATFIVNVFMIFGDLGLGAAFIQNSAAPSQKDLQISFTVQFCLITAVVALTWILAPLTILLYPAIGPNGLWLARAISLLLYVSIFRSISLVQLERDLNYSPIAWAEGVGMCLYQTVAAVGAVSGLGVWSFVLATFVAGIVGAGLLYRAAPWRIRLCFDLAEMRRILRYGASFQFNSIVDTISQWVTPAIVGTMIGPNAVGYLGLAVANAKRPLLFAESVMRVSFPHFSRLQEDIKKLHNTITDYLVGFLWIMVMWATFLWTSSSPLVAIVYSPKWLPAVPALVIFAAALPLDMIIWAMAMSYHATNRNWSAIRIYALRTALNVTLALLLVPRIGFVGIPWAYSVANLASAVLFLCGFAPGFFTRMVRSSWWLVPCAVSGYVCGRVSADLLVPGGNASQVLHFLAGAVPFMAAYLLTSLILVPKHYRDRLLASARNVVFSGRQTGRGVNITFGRVVRPYSVVPRPENLECVASKD